MTLVPFGTVSPALGACALTWYFLTLPEISCTSEPNDAARSAQAVARLRQRHPERARNHAGRVSVACTAAADAVTSAVEVPHT